MRRIGILFGFLSALFPALVSAASDCVEDNTDNCEALGYTEASCPTGGVACPFDKTKWHCASWQCKDGRYVDDNDPDYWSTCVETEYKGKTCYDCRCTLTGGDCAIGDIFYHDGTCAAEYAECMNKTPVGVVYMLTDAAGNIVQTQTSRYGRVVSLKDLRVSSSNYQVDPDNPYNGTVDIPFGYSISSTDDLTGLTLLPNSASQFQLTVGQEGASGSYDGKGSTQKLASLHKTDLSQCREDTGETTHQYCTTVAAIATQSFYPTLELKSDSLVGAGQWYLPSLGELIRLYGIDIEAMTAITGTSGANNENITKINNSLQALIDNGVEAELFTDAQGYLTSTFVNTYSTLWTIQMSDGSRNVKRPLTNAVGRVRASLQFQH